MHSSLAVFRLYGERSAYDDLRDVIVSSSIEKNCVPTFDEYQPGVPVCNVEVCTMHADILLTLHQRDGTGALGASPATSSSDNNGNIPNGSSKSSKNSRISGSSSIISGNSSSSSSLSGEDGNVAVAPCAAEREWSSVEYLSEKPLTSPPPAPDVPRAVGCEAGCAWSPPQSSPAVTPIKPGTASTRGFELELSSEKRAAGEDEEAAATSGDAESSVFEKRGKGGQAAASKKSRDRATTTGDDRKPSASYEYAGLVTSRRVVMVSESIFPSRLSPYNNNGFAAVGSVGDLGTSGPSSATYFVGAGQVPVVSGDGPRRVLAHNRDDQQHQQLLKGGRVSLPRLRDLDTNVAGTWSSSDSEACWPREISLESAPPEESAPKLSDRYLPDGSDWLATQTGVDSIGPDMTTHPGNDTPAEQPQPWTRASGVVDGGGGAAGWNMLRPPAAEEIYRDVGCHPHEHLQQTQRQQRQQRQQQQQQQPSRRNAGLLGSGQARARSTDAIAADGEITPASVGTDAVAAVFGATPPWVVDSPRSRLSSAGGLAASAHPPHPPLRLGQNGPPPHSHPNNPSPPPPPPPPAIMAPAWNNIDQCMDTSGVLSPFDPKRSSASGQQQWGASSSQSTPSSSSQITDVTGSGGMTDGRKGGGGGVGGGCGGGGGRGSLSTPIESSCLSGFPRAAMWDASQLDAWAVPPPRVVVSTTIDIDEPIRAGEFGGEGRGGGSCDLDLASDLGMLLEVDGFFPDERLGGGQKTR